MPEQIVSAQSGIRAHFAEKAVLPKRDLARAETFIKEVQGHLANGAKPPENTVLEGKDLLNTLDDQVEIYAFNAAILAGQAATSEKDLEKQVETIARSLEQAQLTTERLRSTLAAF